MACARVPGLVLRPIFKMKSLLSWLMEGHIMQCDFLGEPKCSERAMLNDFFLLSET